MATNSKYETRLILLTIVIVVVLAIPYFFFLDETKTVIRVTLESSILYFFLWTLTVIIFIIYYLRTTNKKIEQETIFTKKFGEFTDKALGGVYYATVITTSITLLKGIYIQQFFDDKKYFLEFGQLDLMTIFAISIFLLYSSITKVIEIGKEAYRTGQTETVEKAS
jgi:hypothetical protein